MQAGLAGRLRRRVALDFQTDAGAVEEVLSYVASTDQDPERTLAAVVLGSAGDIDWLLGMIELSHLDYRDLLVAGGVADANWPETLDRELGPWLRGISAHHASNSFHEGPPDVLPWDGQFHRRGGS